MVRRSALASAGYLPRFTLQGTDNVGLTTLERCSAEFYADRRKDCLCEVCCDCGEDFRRDFGPAAWSVDVARVRATAAEFYSPLVIFAYPGGAGSHLPSVQMRQGLGYSMPVISP